MSDETGRVADGSTPTPYTEADVQLVHDALAAISLKGFDTWSTTAAMEDAYVRAALAALAAASRLLPEGASPSQRQWIFPMDSKIDALIPDGAHRYWSTHCRHGNHGACAATAIEGEATVLRGVRRQRVRLDSPARIGRKPAQCKTCSAPCICSCHTPTSTEESTE